MAAYSMGCSRVPDRNPQTVFIMWPRCELVACSGRARLRRNARVAHVVFASALSLAGCCLDLPFISSFPRATTAPESAVADGGTDEAAQSDDPTIAQFASPERNVLLLKLAQRWNEAAAAIRDGPYPDIERDPFFAGDTSALLRRYLLAAQLDVDDALERLKATAEWRRDWDVLSYYRPGVARELFGEATNPGAEMYFADSLDVDRRGVPYVVGRLRLANAENMHPWRHLRAGVLVFELLATKIAALGRGPASYILDIGSIGGYAGNVSGTGGLERAYDEGKNPYYKEGAGTKDAPSQKCVEELGSLDNGFAVLKAAIQILNRHYPGIIGHVFYLNSDMLFWGAFKIFSRWIADRGSIKFDFLGPVGWREKPISALHDFFASDRLCNEWGGSGSALDGDKFLERAIHQYEADAVQRREDQGCV
mmetsp:Transcript_80212/g.223372  ORF Transcript_80212/g.223372 Transcript_80212/m.223372 type:complete len:423 (+) Transcript_80212:25-1293(+)